MTDPPSAEASAQGTPADAPPGVQGPPGPLLSVVKDQRLAFLIVGGLNTAIGFVAFVFFQHFVGRHAGRYGYMVTLGCAHVVAVLCAFWLYRHLVFRVRGHVLADLARFESVYLVSLGVNAALLPLLVEVGHLTPIVSQLVVLVATTAISWFGHKYFSFRRTPSPDQPEVHP